MAAGREQILQGGEQ